MILWSLEIEYPNFWMEFAYRIFVCIYIHTYINNLISVFFPLVFNFDPYERTSMDILLTLGKHGMTWTFHQKHYGEIGQQV